MQSFFYLVSSYRNVHLGSMRDQSALPCRHCCRYFMQGPLGNHAESIAYRFVTFTNDFSSQIIFFVELDDDFFYGALKKS